MMNDIGNAGSETSLNSLKMTGKRFMHGVLIGLCGGLLSVYIVTAYIVPITIVTSAERLAYNCINTSLWNGNSIKTYQIGGQPFTHSHTLWCAYYRDLDNEKHYITSFWKWEVYAFLGGITLGFIGWIKYTNWHGAKLMARRYVRGAKLVTTAKVLKTFKGLPAMLPLGRQLWWPDSKHTSHMLILGNPGTGKGRLLIPLIAAALKTPRRKVLINDPKGDYTSKLYIPALGDVILCPYDPRAAGYTIFNDIVTELDVDLFAATIVSSIKEETDPTWILAGRNLFVGTLHALFAHGKAAGKTVTNAELNRVFNETTREQLVAYLDGVPAAAAAKSLIDSADPKSTSVHFSMKNKTLPIFRPLARTDGAFSITEWVQSNQHGALFLPGSQEVLKSLGGFYTFILDMVISRALSLADDLDRRLYLMLDEFGELPNSANIGSALSMGRSKGVSVVCALQSIAMIEARLGRERAAVLSDIFGTMAFFRCGKDSAEWASKCVGDHEYDQRKTTTVYGPADNRASNSLVDERRKEPLLAPEYFKSLSDFSFVGHIAGLDGWFESTTVRPPDKAKKGFLGWDAIPPDSQAGFIMREDAKLENIHRDVVPGTPLSKPIGAQEGDKKQGEGTFHEEVSL